MNANLKSLDVGKEKKSFIAQFYKGLIAADFVLLHSGVAKAMLQVQSVEPPVQTASGLIFLPKLPSCSS